MALLDTVDKLPRIVDEDSGCEYVRARHHTSAEWQEYQVVHLDDNGARVAMPDAGRFLNGNWSVSNPATGGIFR